MYYPDQPFHIRTYKKSELAHLYNPNVCLKVALQILRRWIVYNKKTKSSILLFYKQISLQPQIKKNKPTWSILPSFKTFTAS